MKRTSAPFARSTRMILPARRQVLAGLGAGLVAACTSTPPKREFAEITFTHEPPILLDVARVEFVDFVPPPDPPHAEGDFPVPPTAAARRWVLDRLQAVGAQRTARATLLDASGIRTDLATSGGVSGYFTNDQARRYETRVAMRVDIVAEGSRFVEGFAQAEAAYADTTSEDATINQREAILYALVEKLMADFDNRLEGAIRNYLAAYVR